MITDAQILAAMPAHPVSLAWLNERLPERVTAVRLRAVVGIRRHNTRFALITCKVRGLNSSIQSIPEAMCRTK